MFIGLFIFMLFMSLILALWEIQIEGPDGWAAKLPAWRIEKGWPTLIMGGRPLTGYHVFMTIFMIAIIHLPFFFTPWSWRLEFLVFGFYSGMMLFEDFFWFIFNPHYGIKKFRKGQMWWHKTWWGPVPSMYWPLAVFAAVMFYFGYPAI